MSRTIDPEAVLSQEDIDYLAARGHDDVLAQNAAYLIERHGSELAAEKPDDTNTGEVDTTESVKEPEVNLNSLKKPELIAMAEEKGLDTEGTREDLIARLTETPAEPV